MKLKLKQLVESFPPLMELSSSNDVPAMAGFRIGKLAKVALEEMKGYEAAVQKLRDDAGAELDESKTRFVFPSKESEVEVERQYQELVGVEIELPGEPIKAESLGKATLAPLKLMALDWLIVE